MGRKKKDRSQPKPLDSVSFKPWTVDKEITFTSFAMVSESLFLNPTFQSLPPSARLVYIALCMACHGKDTFTFTKGYYERLGYSKSTVIDAIDKLIKKGFITKRRFYGGKATQYTFRYDWKTKL